MDGLRRVFLSHSPVSRSKFPRLSDRKHDNDQELHDSLHSRFVDKSQSSHTSKTLNSHNVLDLDKADVYEEGIESARTSRTFPLSRLPEDVLLHVFRFLGLNDRVRVSSVCRNWRHLVFTSPRLWRRRQLTLRCSSHSAHSRKACFYARRLGKYLHKLTVACEHPNNHSCRSMAVCFRKLLASLKTPLSLTSFKVIDLRLRYNTRPSVLLNISTSLEKLIRSLHRLKSFQMSDAHWPAEEGLRVISSVLNRSDGAKSSLQTLRIDGFFVPRFVPSEATEVLAKGLGNLSCLTKLSIDYFYLSEETVLTLASSRQGQLRSLKLVACDVSPHSRFVSKFAWMALTTSCPSLRVEFSVQGFTVSPARSLPLLLCPALRVSKVKLAIGAQFTFQDMGRLNMAAVLGHVTRHYRRRLIRFEMDIDNHNDALDAALIRMVRKCRNLVSVKVTAYFNNPDTDVIVRDLVRARRDKQAADASAGTGGGTGGDGGIGREGEARREEEVPGERDETNSARTDGDRYVQSRAALAANGGGLNLVVRVVDVAGNRTASVGVGPNHDDGRSGGSVGLSIDGRGASGRDDAETNLAHHGENHTGTGSVRDEARLGVGSAGGSILAGPSGRAGQTDGAGTCSDGPDQGAPGGSSSISSRTRFGSSTGIVGRDDHRSVAVGAGSSQDDDHGHVVLQRCD